jgi:hypothetical protein
LSLGLLPICLGQIIPSTLFQVIPASMFFPV